LALLLVLVLASPVWAFPDNGVLDNFTGCVDTTTPPNSNWTNTIIYGASSGTVDCEDLAATSTVTGTESDMYWNVSTFDANSEAYATIVTTSGFVSEEVLVRLVNLGASTTDGYSVVATDSDSKVSMYRIDNGAATLLGTAVSQTIGAGDAIGIRAAGSSICSWYKVGAGAWTQLDCQTDATYSAGGRIGLVVNGNTGIGIADNFGGGNVASAAGALRRRVQ
jgi:hypothetical protein